MSMTYSIINCGNDDIKELTDALDCEFVKYERLDPWRFIIYDPEDMEAFEDICDSYGLDYEGVWD